MTTATPLGPQNPDLRTPEPRRLHRSDTDRMVAGVSGGLADYTGIDATVWRVGFVALTVLGGSGALLYVLLWVVVPPAPVAPGTRVGSLDRAVERLRTALVDLTRGSGRS
jgi:phage shock protein C